MIALLYFEDAQKELFPLYVRLCAMVDVFYEYFIYYTENSPNFGRKFSSFSNVDTFLNNDNLPLNSMSFLLDDIEIGC